MPIGFTVSATSPRSLPEGAVSLGVGTPPSPGEPQGEMPCFPAWEVVWKEEVVAKWGQTRTASQSPLRHEAHPVERYQAGER